MTDAEKEQTKLTATFLSNFALAIIVAGFVAPLAALSLHLSGSPPTDGFTITVSLVWLSTGVSLHLLARRILRRLRA
jgi:hypothetical protein